MFKKIKLMETLFKLWNAINSPSTSAAWKLNHVDFLKAIFRTLVISGGYTALTYYVNNQSIDWMNVAQVTGTALVALLAHGIISNSNPSAPTTK